MPTTIEFVTVYTDKDGKRVETPMNLRDDAALGPSEEVDDTTVRYVWHDRAQ
jgi:hypothetical protein